MRHNEAEKTDKNGIVVKCRQRLREVRHHERFRGFYCAACKEYLFKQHNHS